MGKNLPIGERLSDERKRLGYNQSDFSALAGITRKHYLAMKAGEGPGCPGSGCLGESGLDVLYVVTGQRQHYLAMKAGEGPGCPGSGCLGEKRTGCSLCRDRSAPRSAAPAPARAGGPPRRTHPVGQLPAQPARRSGRTQGDERENGMTNKGRQMDFKVLLGAVMLAGLSVAGCSTKTMADSRN